MKFTDIFARWFKRILPSPFTLAIVLTLFVLAVALIFQKPNDVSFSDYVHKLLSAWDGKMWDNGLLAFLVQMMLMLVLGHTLALSGPFSRLANRATRICTTPAIAAAVVTAATIAVSLFNWGLGLIFGAILARKVGERFKQLGQPLNYALIGACGYVGLMVWHGGISGSSLIKISQSGAIHDMMANAGWSSEKIQQLPDSIGFEHTVFGTMNITVSLILLILLPTVMYFIARKSPGKAVPDMIIHNERDTTESAVGAERLDVSRVFAYVIGTLILLFAVYKGYRAQADGLSLSFINPNYINLSLLGMCFIAHGTFRSFLSSSEEAVKGASGVLLQFPLYFGILGIVTASGMVQDLADFFVQISSESSYPIFNFMGSGIVNIFVPSGGGQWVIQGPLIVESATKIGSDLNTNIMALAYGDQLTNMLQPFWALPLLAITGLKAKQILPYTLVLMLVGGVVFCTALILH